MGMKPTLFTTICPQREAEAFSFPRERSETEEEPLF